MYLKYTIGGITTMANKHMLSANMVLFLFSSFPVVKNQYTLKIY